MIACDRQITIRPIRESDIEVLAKWLSDPVVLEFYEGRDNSFDTNKIREKYFCEEEGANRCIIEYESKPIGYVQFYPLDNEGVKEYEYPWQIQNAYGMDQFIGEPNLWGQGLGRAFIKGVLDYLRNHLKAEVVVLDPHTDNLRAIRCYEACGFEKVKRLERHELHEGKYHECWLMAYKIKR